MLAGTTYGQRGHSMYVIRLDLEHDPVPPDRFHMIIVGMAMHHIADTETVLRAFSRVAAAGSILCIADLDAKLARSGRGRRS